jgi:hypothetical protein
MHHSLLLLGFHQKITACQGSRKPLYFATLLDSSNIQSVMNIHLLDIPYLFRNITVGFAAAKMFVAEIIIFHAGIHPLSIS